MATDILSPTEYATACRMAADQGFGDVQNISWLPDDRDRYVVPTIRTKKGKALSLYYVPDGAGGWRKLYRKRGVANGVE